jgi:hypothetical protein
MSYGSEGYLSRHHDNEQVTKVIRSVMQDGCRDLRKTTLDTIFVEKKVDNVDIGKICSDLIIKITGSLKDYEFEKDSPDEKETIEELLTIIVVDYDQGINPNKDIVWTYTWILKGMPLFGKKINTLPAIGKIAPMASLEKPAETELRKDIKKVNW